MRQFESFLKNHLEAFKAYRIDLGYSMKSNVSALFLFDRYVKENAHNLSALNWAFFLEFQNSLHQAPRTINQIITTVRIFFDFLVRKEVCDTNPLQDIPAKKETSYIPFIFSNKQTDAFLEVIEKGIRKERAYYLKDMTLYLIFLCIIRCGLRISEPLKLLRSHYRSNEGTLYIEKTKFGKDRLIPVPEAVRFQIDNYLSVQKELSGNYYDYFFSWNNHKVSNRNMYPLFHRTIKKIGINEPERQIEGVLFKSPTVHSFRHSFAVNTLKSIRLRGDSPQHALPILSAYMGHKKYRYTSLYLKVLDADQRNEMIDFNISHHKDL